MSSTDPGARGRLDTPFLFREIPLGSPLEELEIVYRRRKESSRTLGEDDTVWLEQAYAVARSCLEAVLNQAHAPGSPLVAEAPAARESATGSEAGPCDPSDPSLGSRNAEESPELPPSEAAGGSA